MVTTLGVAQLIYGAPILYDNRYRATSTNDNDFWVGLAWTLSGSAAVMVGGTLFIVGQTRRSKSKKALEHFNGDVSLSFRTTNNGVGLVLNF